MTYFAHNPRTDEIFASPCFKRVYNAAFLELRYVDSATESGVFYIYAVDVDFENFTYAQVLPQFTRANKRCKLYVQWLSNTIRVVNYPCGNYKSNIVLQKREIS